MVGYIFVTFLVIGACNATNKEFERPQIAFRKINENDDALAPKDIIASHVVYSAIECSFQCHREKRCVGFNYLDMAKTSEINCHISNATTTSRVKTVLVKEKWTFYQALFKTGEKGDGQSSGKNITSNLKQSASSEGSGLDNGLTKEKDCADLYKKGEKKNGVYEIDPDGQGTFSVFCDMTSSGGGWTVFQRRQDGSVDFYRDWKNYTQGFGNLTSEFWLGLDKIYRLTSAKRNKLRVDLGDWSGNKAYAEYDYFAVKNESKKYQLNHGAYFGNAGDALSYHNGMAFTTKDSDNDKHGGNCAIGHWGAWWYNGCHSSNLNGHYYRSNQSNFNGVNWRHWKEYESLKFTEMKIKP
ncbi:ryncolin-1-like [Xenia sp. Carnegie-2017]|uniref:ryncolin-1-like n=1 Tax=Xenia sp. Carnegie-2017 TaxID=2897299 RepID=UPI001F04C492|nr:ryncolin-1-like [Xenia sp. Carnegie-2017]